MSILWTVLSYAGSIEVSHPVCTGLEDSSSDTEDDDLENLGYDFEAEEDDTAQETEDVQQPAPSTSAAAAPPPATRMNIFDRIQQHYEVI